MPLTRKLYRQGNSVVVALPSYMLEHCQLDIGDTVIFSLNMDRSLNLARFLPPDLSPEIPSQKLTPDTAPGGQNNGDDPA